MDRWVANTLRTLGIVLLAGFILVTSLILLLLSMCAWQGGFGGGSQPDQGIEFLAAAVVLLAGGIWIIARLSRSLMRSAAAAREQSAAPSEDIPFSPSGQRAVNLLAQAMGAQIVLSALGWVWSELHYSRMASSIALNWTWALLVPFVLYHVPYAILIFRLLRKPDLRAFAYSLAVPGVILFQSLFSLALVTRMYLFQPAGFLFLLVPWLMHFLIVWLAYKAIQQVSLHPEPPLLFRAALMTFVYFFVIHVATPFFYSFARMSHG